MRPPPLDDRSLSPVVGVALIIVITVLLSSFGAYFMFGLSQQTESAPEVRFEVVKTEQPLEYRLIHESGDKINGDRVEIRGTASEKPITDTEFGSGERVSLYPTQETVEIVWFNDHGESFVLKRFEAEETAPEPNRGCAYVQKLKTNGNSGVNPDPGTVINCDIVAGGDIGIPDNVVVLGRVEANGHGIDIGNSEIYGPVSADGPVDLTGGATVYGSVTASGDVNMQGSTVAGRIDTTSSGAAVDLDGGTVKGDIVSGGDFNVDGSGRIEGNVVSDSGNIDVDPSTITGHVYGSLSCSGATINGESCSEYTAKPVSAYG
jgi:FlaG/FlaF family flagellin (archaellin)/cytoskeletal protein CcmA (bactofilin family)